jgi:DNA-binding PadR family transcriptional regulator
MTDSPTVSTLGYALLGLLTRHPMTGYELTQTFDISLANVWSARHSQIYPELAKLQAAGLIVQTESGPRGSKRYAATDAGTEAVRRWLRTPPPAELMRSERLLRVFFFGMLPPEEAAALFRAEAARHRERLEHHLATAELIPPAPGPARLGRIALEAGIRFERMMTEWADWAAAEIQR